MDLVVVPRVVTFELILLEKPVTVIEAKKENKGHDIHLDYGPDDNLVSWHVHEPYNHSDVLHNEEKPFEWADYNHLSVLISEIWNEVQLKNSWKNYYLEQVRFSNNKSFIS